MVLGRSRRKVLLLDDGNPRNKKSRGIHNYLTRDGILPADFLSTCYKDLEFYKVTFSRCRAVAVKRQGNGFELMDNQGRTYTCRKLLVATGVTDIIPDIPGMQELWGCGVYHCPYCDGWELYGETVGLYARRYNGYGMALALRKLTDKVILFTDTAQYLKSIQKQHLKAMGIAVYTGKITHLTQDNGKLTCVNLAHGRQVGCNSLFSHNGIKYNNELILQLGGRCTARGATLISRRQECSVPGVYVAGDVAFDMQFVAVAAAEGVKAAVSINNALHQEDNALSLGKLLQAK